jgi:hypothetical protein
MIEGKPVVVGVDMDGASNCIKAMKACEKRLGLWGQRCAAHGASLLIKDIAKFWAFLEALRLLIFLICFIKRHDAIAMVVKKEGGKALEVPVDTRFAKLHICAVTVMKSLPAIKRAFNSEAIMDWVESNADEDIEEVHDNVVRKTKLRESYDKIMNECLENREWNHTVNLFIDLTAPAYGFLREMDKDSPTLSKCSRLYHQALMKLNSKREDMTIDEDKEIYDGVLIIYNRRKKDCVSVLADGAAYVDTTNLFSALTDSGDGVFEVYNTITGSASFEAAVVIKCTSGPMDGERITDWTMVAEIAELAVSYRNHEGVFAIGPRELPKLKISQSNYFRDFRASEDPAMRMFADICTFLSLGYASSSRVERLNGDLKSTMTSKRVARLGHEKVNKLMRISTTYSMLKSLAKKEIKPQLILDTFDKDLREAVAERRAFRALADQVDNIDLELPDEEIDEDDDEGWFDMLLGNRAMYANDDLIMNRDEDMIAGIFDMEEHDMVMNAQDNVAGNEERNVRRKANEQIEFDFEIDGDLFL